MSKLAERQKHAQEQIRQAISLMADARRELTIWEYEQFIRENIETLGYHGFISSIGQALVNAATIDTDLGRAALSEQKEERG